MHHVLLIDILLLLATTVLMVALARKLRMPPIIGYLAVGVLIGPHGLSWLEDAGEIHFMAELGVMFLMFMLGLEFSLPVLIASRRAVFGAGGAQVLATGVLAALLANLAGLDLPQSVALGAAFAMSSTAIVLKQLTEQGELATRHGRLAVAILLFQDLATLPFLVAIPVMAMANGQLGAALLLALGKAVLIFVALLMVGRWLINPVIHWVARAKAADFFVLTTLLMILGAATAASLAGLSLAMGAFLAGTVVSETPFKHYVEAEIRPFQDVLLGLFFVTVGMQLNPATLVSSWQPVLVLLVLILLGKPLILLSIGMIIRTHPGVVLRTGVILGHVGEFGLLLLTLAMTEKLLPQEIGQVALAAMVLSMMVAPILIRYNSLGLRRINFLGYRDNLERQEERAARASQELDDHVILCGYGRFGQHLARFLELERIPYVVLDLDSDRVRRARAAHKRVIYGDAARLALLQAVGLMRARAIAITFADPNMALKILHQVRVHRADIPILVRTTDLAELERLEAAGANEVLPEALEASILMAAQLLLLMGIPHSRVEEHMETVRGDQYRLLRGCLNGTDPFQPVAENCAEEVRSVHLPSHSWLVGRKFQELDTKSFGVTVVAIQRGGIRIPELSIDTAFRPNDVLVMIGLPEALKRAEALILAPPNGYSKTTHHA